MKFQTISGIIKNTKKWLGGAYASLYKCEINWKAKAGFDKSAV